MKLLVLGGDVCLGRQLVEHLSGQHEVNFVPRAAFSYSMADLTRDVWKPQPQPAWVIDCVGCHSETDNRNTFDLYAVYEHGPARLARMVDDMRSKDGPTRLLQVSTISVYRSDQGPYKEEDEPNVYGVGIAALATTFGQVKARQTLGPYFTLVRTGWLYGPYCSGDFLSAILQGAQEKSSLEATMDEYGNPTCTCDLAEAIGKLLISGHEGGTFHLVSEADASRWQFAAKALELAGFSNLTVDPVVRPSFLVQGLTKAPLPRDSRLLNRRAAAMAITLPPWEEALAGYIEGLSLSVPV